MDAPFTNLRDGTHGWAFVQLLNLRVKSYFSSSVLCGVSQCLTLSFAHANLSPPVLKTDAGCRG